MRREAIVEHIALIPLGEIRMGCDAYGMLITTNFGVFDFLKNKPVLIGTQDHSRIIEQSSCKRYLLIKAAFTTYILDIKEQAISVYKTNIRGSSGEWCEEHAVYGKKNEHIKGFSTHYFLQFPFVKQDKFDQVLAGYESLRRRQIEEAVNALG
ncbi:hypothetical protein ABMA58_04310 [Oceanospirillum sp. HFRX-1_2]